MCLYIYRSYLLKYQPLGNVNISMFVCACVCRRNRRGERGTFYYVFDDYQTDFNSGCAVCLQKRLAYHINKMALICVFLFVLGSVWLCVNVVGQS